MSEQVKSSTDKLKPLTLGHFRCITDCRRSWFLSWPLGGSLPPLQFLFIYFILFCGPSLGPVEHRPLSYPQSGQEHVFAHLFLFVIYHQMIAERNWSSWPRSPRPRSFHGITVNLSCYVLFPLSPVHVLPEFLKHSLPGLFTDFTTQPAWCLFAGARGAPRSHCSWLLCHNRTIFFALAGVCFTLHPQLFLPVLLPLWGICRFSFGFFSTSCCHIQTSGPICSPRACWKKEWKNSVSNVVLCSGSVTEYRIDTCPKVVG